MKIKTVDLITIGEGIKAIKQKTVLFLNNNLYGLDNINGYLVYTSLNGLLQDDFAYNNGIIINARELSAFIKGITSESEFDIGTSESNVVLETISGCNMSISRDKRLSNMVNFKFINITGKRYSEAIHVTEDLSELFSMKKGDGTYYYKYEYNMNTYFMTLFSGLLPLNKGDKILIKLLDCNMDSFIGNFIIRKKKFNVNVYVAYIKV